MLDEMPIDKGIDLAGFIIEIDGYLSLQGRYQERRDLKWLFCRNASFTA